MSHEIHDKMEISNRFCLLAPDSVHDALLLGHAVVPGSSTRVYSAVGAIVFDQTPSEGDAGVTWNQTFRAVTYDPNVQQLDGARCNPAFYMSDGSLRVIGTHDSAPVITVTPSNGGCYLVQASFQAPEALSL